MLDEAEFNYERLAADLEAACSIDAGQEAEEGRNEARSRLAEFFWRARIARGDLNAATADPHERAKAHSIWALLFRLAYSRRCELPPDEIARRCNVLKELAAAAGLSDLHHQLRRFAENIATACLISPDPVKKLARILHGPPKAGPKERPFRKRIEIAAMVQRFRDADMALEKACERVVGTTSPRIGSDAVRRIYENATKTKRGAALVRLVANDEVEL
jgi:hypothetical protein